MQYYSTEHKAPDASLQQAVVQGLAEDRGLYMPERIPAFSAEWIRRFPELSFVEIGQEVAAAFFGEDIPRAELDRIVAETLSFDCPAVPVEDGIYALELFHGPTLAFKDVGARFMARLLGHFTQEGNVNVLVATSGDTGSAVANGFLGVPGTHVFVLYPRGRVSPVQEAQFATLGQNITALEVDGSFDDCQALVKAAFLDPDLRRVLRLTSANSINVARFLPQSFYYFHGYAQLARQGRADRLTVCVPSGNLGNLCAALVAAKMGLPVHRFIAANNRNDVFFQYLQTGAYSPALSIRTLANAMDVGNPSNFARILDLYNHNWLKIRKDISGAVVGDGTIISTIRQCYEDTGYLLDPHGACGYRALKDGLREGETGLFCETAHPAKFQETVSRATGTDIPLPARLAAFLKGTKQTVPLSATFPAFKTFLLSYALR